MRSFHEVVITRQRGFVNTGFYECSRLGPLSVSFGPRLPLATVQHCPSLTIVWPSLQPSSAQLANHHRLCLRPPSNLTIVWPAPLPTTMLLHLQTPSTIAYCRLPTSHRTSLVSSHCFMLTVVVRYSFLWAWACDIASKCEKPYPKPL